MRKLHDCAAIPVGTCPASPFLPLVSLATVMGSLYSPSLTAFARGDPSESTILRRDHTASDSEACVSGGNRSRSWDLKSYQSRAANAGRARLVSGSNPQRALVSFHWNWSGLCEDKTICLISLILPLIIDGLRVR